MFTNDIADFIMLEKITSHCVKWLDSFVGGKEESFCNLCLQREKKNPLSTDILLLDWEY